MTYEVLVERDAIKSLKKIPDPYKQNIFAKIKKLEKFNSSSPNIKKLRGYPDGYRLRVENYRVLFVVDNTSETIRVYSVGHRKEVYTL